MALPTRMARTHVRKALDIFQKENSTQFSAGPIGDNICNWQAMIVGPERSPYENGIFFLNIDFGDQYPFYPPKIQFLTPIFHPNINCAGIICMELLHKDNWQLNIPISDILVKIISVLSNPSPDNVRGSCVANMFLSDPEEYKKVATEWTRRYAM